MDKHRVTRGPASMYYIPDFLTREEESLILARIPSNRWITLSHRRLQAVPSRLTATNTLLASPLPTWLTQPTVDRISALGVFSDSPHAGINHCLINEYLPGQGIMAHEDGAAYHPVVATVSLGGTVVLDVHGKGKADGDGGEDGNVGEGQTVWRVVQEPRSLLVTTNPAYEETLHGIAEVEVDEGLNAETVANWELLGDPGLLATEGGKNRREPRISLTFRDVRKVSNLGSNIFGKPRG